MVSALQLQLSLAHLHALHSSGVAILHVLLVALQNLNAAANEQGCMYAYLIQSANRETLLCKAAGSTAFVYAVSVTHTLATKFMVVA